MKDSRIDIDYTVQLWREGNNYIAHAMPLDVISAGGGPQQAREALDEAIALFLKTAAENGTVEEVLEESGYTYTDGRWTSPDWISVERHTLSVAS